MARTVITAFLLTFIFLGLSGNAKAQAAFAGDDILGEWKTGQRAGSWGYVQFDRCGARFCGTLIGGGGRNVNPNYFGTRIVDGMRWAQGRYEDGRIFDVENNRWYLAKMTPLANGKLKVSGCVLGRLICGSQIWERHK